MVVLCMSANAFGPDWALLESGTFRFRDPLNNERRFLPLHLDDAPQQRLSGAIALRQLVPVTSLRHGWIEPAPHPKLKPTAIHLL